MSVPNSQIAAAAQTLDQRRQDGIHSGEAVTGWGMHMGEVSPFEEAAEQGEAAGLREVGCRGEAVGIEGVGQGWEAVELGQPPKEAALETDLYTRGSELPAYS